MSDFKYTQSTDVIIDVKPHVVQMANGMTGIGSRAWSLDGKNQFYNCVTQSEDIAQGNHSVYTIQWRDTPWDKIDIIIHESHIPWLLDEENAWRKPVKREIN